MNGLLKGKYLTYITYRPGAKNPPHLILGAQEIALDRKHGLRALHILLLQISFLPRILVGKPAPRRTPTYSRLD
jgi:hypothetical protein